MHNIQLLNLKTKSLESSADIEITGYASVFDIADYHNDIIVKGAFQNSLKDSNRSIKLLWQHDVKIPIGMIKRAYEDDYGLHVEAIITSGTEKGKEAIDLITKGIIKGLSIGFNIVKSYQDNQGRRIINDLDLWEISLVTFPANKASGIEANHINKSFLHQTLKEAEQQLKSINQKRKYGFNN